MESSLTDKCFNHIDATPKPLLESVESIIRQAKSILFPGYFTIEDDVIIYSNTTILGEETVIGARLTIGGSVWIINESVPPDTKVVLKKPELIYSGYNCKQSSRPQEEKPTIHFPADTKIAG